MSRKWETWRSDGVGNVFWTETFLIRRRRKKETVEAWRRSPMGMNKTEAEHGERSWGKPMVPFAHTHTHTRMGCREEPKETWSTRYRSMTLGMEALGSYHQPRHQPWSWGSRQPDPQKRLVQCLINRSHGCTVMPNWVPALRPSGSHSSSQCWTKN